MNKHLSFFLVNSTIISLFTFLALLFWNRFENDFPKKMFLYSVLIASVIVIFQYPVLNYKKNWYYKTLIFYISMLLFLFLFGLTNGIHLQNSISSRLDAALKMMLIGQVFGGFFGFLVLLGINFSLKSILFKK